MTYTENIEMLSSMLSAYRNAPPDALTRKYIDWIVGVSRNAAVEVDEKRLHNLVILEYITDTKRAKSAICKALHIGRDSYDAAKERAIDRLCVLAFGVDGIDWGEGTSGPALEQKTDSQVSTSQEAEKSRRNCP